MKDKTKRKVGYKVFWVGQFSFRLGTIQRYRLQQLLTGSEIYKYYSTGEKLCCQALERMGLVECSVAGIVSITERGRAVAQQFCSDI